MSWDLIFDSGFHHPNRPKMIWYDPIKHNSVEVEYLYLGFSALNLASLKSSTIICYIRVLFSVE